MKHFTHIFWAGLALFAILFGSGNIVFPLVLGKHTGSMVWFAIIGLSISAIIVPLIGLVSTMLVDGKYKRLLGLLGPTTARVITLVCFLLIGPFGVIPRCITIAHAAIALYFPSLSLMAFTLASVSLIFACTVKKTMVIDIIGRFLGPLKLTLLLSIILFGLGHRG